MRLVYIILHYNTLEDTRACVNKIFEYTNLEENDINIIIVDNASPNKSGKKLKEEYRHNGNITVICNKRNLGFARGNNIGFIYAKKNLDPEFIVLCNNDTELMDGKIYDEIILMQKKYDFAVMGPRELLPGGIYYPLDMVMPKAEEVRKKISLYSKKIFFCLFCLGDLKDKNVEEKNICLDGSEVHKNIVLHGAFLIFSKKYIELFDGLDPRTFLYCEEYLLAMRLRKYGLVSLYDPEITIFHKKGQATNSRTSNDRWRKIRRWMEERKSLKILYSELNKDL